MEKRAILISEADVDFRRIRRETKGGVCVNPDGFTSYGRDGTFCECKHLEEIVVDNDNAVYGSQDGMLYRKGMAALDILLCCPAGKKGSVRIADGASEIGKAAFWICNSLTRIEIPASVWKVAGLKNCSSLMEIAVDEDNESYASDNGILYMKDMTELVCCPSGKAGSVAAPDGVTAIDGAAFDDCDGLTSIFLSKTSRRRILRKQSATCHF